MSHREEREQQERKLTAIQQAFQQELEPQLAWMRWLPQEALTKQDLNFLHDADRREQDINWFRQNYLSDIVQLQRYQNSATGAYDFVQHMLDGHWTKGYQEKVMIVAAAKAISTQQNLTGDWIHQQQFAVRNKAFQVIQWTVGGIVAVPIAIIFTGLALLSVVCGRSTGFAALLFKSLGCVICGIGYGAGYLAGKPSKQVQFDRIFRSKPASKKQPRVSVLNEVAWRARKEVGYQPLPDGPSKA